MYNSEKVYLNHYKLYSKFLLQGKKWLPLVHKYQLQKLHLMKCPLTDLITLEYLYGLWFIDKQRVMRTVYHINGDIWETLIWWTRSEAKLCPEKQMGCKWELCETNTEKWGCNLGCAVPRNELYKVSSFQLET